MGLIPATADSSFAFTPDFSSTGSRSRFCTCCAWCCACATASDVLESSGRALLEEEVLEEELLEEEVMEENVEQVNDAALEEPESILSATAVAVEPEQSGEDQESTRLDAEVVEGDAVAGGEAEQHGEHPEASGGEERNPDKAPESTPGGL